MLSDTCDKQQNKIGKIFKNSKFHFFKIEPKLGKTNLSCPVKNVNKVVFQKQPRLFGPKRGEGLLFGFFASIFVLCSPKFFWEGFRICRVVGRNFLVVCLFSAEKWVGSKKNPSKNRVFSQFFQKMTKIWPILKFFCLLFFCNKSPKQFSETFLKQIKTIFRANSHVLTHNLYFLGSYVKIRIFCEKS